MYCVMQPSVPSLQIASMNTLFLLVFHALQKLQERQATLKKCTIGEKEKEKWNKVMTAEMLLSEESNNGEDDVVIVQPLPWRSGRVTRFFKVTGKRTLLRRWALLLR